MGELIDITCVLKSRKTEKSRENADKDRETKLCENGHIGFEIFERFLKNRKANEIGERYSFISRDFLDQYKGGLFEMNTVMSAMAGEISSTNTASEIKARLINAIKPDLDEILYVLCEDQSDLALLIYEIESMNPTPAFILEKAERLLALQRDVIDMYEIIFIAAKL